MVVCDTLNYGGTCDGATCSSHTERAILVLVGPVGAGQISHGTCTWPASDDSAWTCESHQGIAATGPGTVVFVGQRTVANRSGVVECELVVDGPAGRQAIQGSPTCEHLTLGPLLPPLLP